MFVFVSLLCIGLLINGGLTSGFKEDAADMTITTSCHDEERQALLGLGIMGNLVGRYSNLSVWKYKENMDCCQWMGVLCNKRTGHVTELNLSFFSNGLYGNISHFLSLLSQLSQLEYLDLSKIHFQLNPIPHSLSLLTNLRHLKLSSNSLSGPIPHQLANLSNLETLNLSNNSLSGPIPFFLGDLTSLTYLDLSQNRLEGLIPKSFGILPFLVQLDLSNNVLNGSVPNFSGCPSLRQLDLSRNGLTGNLPKNVGNISNLERLDVSSNSLTGLISDVHFLNITKLLYLDLSSNSFTLNLSSYALISFRLKTIKMQSCKLGPSFPEWIQTQRHFIHLDISNAGISDRVPRWFWDLPPGLRFLNLSSNEIKGMLPKMTLSFERYPGMDLSNNQLEGTIQSLPSKLATLNLSGNRFSGTLSFLCQIDMALTFLDLSNNLLSGSLPDCLKRFHVNLVVLNLSNNKLTGEIPSYLGFFSVLRALYLRRNTFVGEVPKSLSNCTTLRFVDLGENMLSGNIPEWIGEKLSELYVLVLRSNRFNGSLPSQICFLSNLQFLDLSNNALSGHIPRCFGNFTAMATTQFQDDIMIHSYFSYLLNPLNRLRFRHPRSIHRYPLAEVYEAALFLDNALVVWKGKQREFGRGLYLLKSIDISSNKLYGKLPYEITNLQGLVSLNFSINNLHGEIPKHMGRLTSLDSLDLSRNEFSGNIPSSLSQITRLSYLDLSYNNLSGRIPLGPQLQLFNSSFYTGNPQLCGLPLTQRCGPPPPPPPPATVVRKEDVEEDRDEFWISYYTGTGAGFVVGFLGICGALYLNRACRYFIFASLNSVNDWIYVIVVVHFRRLHRKFRW